MISSGSAKLLASQAALHEPWGRHGGLQLGGDVQQMGGRLPRARAVAARHVFVHTPPASFLRFPRPPTSVNVCSLATETRGVDDSHMHETEWLLVNMKSACQQTAVSVDFSGGAAS